MRRIVLALVVCGCGAEPQGTPDAGPDASSFAWEAETSTAVSALFGAWAPGDGSVFAVGDDVYRSPGDGTWTINDPRAARAISGRGATDVYAVGEAGTIAHRDDLGWLAQSSNTTNLLGGVWAGAGEVIAVGNLGTVLRSTGGAWATEATGAGTGDLLGVTGAGDTVFVVGAGGVVLRRSAGTWSVEVSNTGAFLSGVAAIDAFDVWAVGGDLVGSQTLLHYDGDDWTPDTRDGETLYGAYAVAADDVYAVGRAGTILHYDGTAWQAEPSGTTEDLYAVTGAGDDVWVVGAAGTTLRRVAR